MVSYEDTTVAVDTTGIVIRRYGMLGGERRIEFAEIGSVKQKSTGIGARWRMAGAGPGSGGRNWYGWDGNRRSKHVMFVLDVGGFWRPTVTPDDPEAFSDALPKKLVA